MEKANSGLRSQWSEWDKLVQRVRGFGMPVLVLEKEIQKKNATPTEEVTWEPVVLKEETPSPLTIRVEAVKVEVKVGYRSGLFDVCLVKFYSFFELDKSRYYYIIFEYIESV
jgi:hypothetical protein